MRKQLKRPQEAGDNMSREAWIKFFETGTAKELELICGKKLAKKILEERRRP